MSPLQNISCCHHVFMSLLTRKQLLVEFMDIVVSHGRRIERQLHSQWVEEGEIVKFVFERFFLLVVSYQICLGGLL